MARPAVQWGVALALFGLGLLLLGRDVEFWNAVWYVPAWYGYLLALNATLTGLGRRDFLCHRGGELLTMLAWSVPFWYVFEAYNLVLQNWYYVFVFHRFWHGFLFSLFAFATVLPACFFHAELIEALGWSPEARHAPVPVGAKLRALWLMAGLLCLLLPLIWPRQTFPLVWGALLWLPDLLNYRRGRTSFLGDLERGSSRRLTQLLLGGMWAGLVWELMNFWSRCKWIYTVPGFEHWKLFEMPIPGFFGFPVLALSAAASWQTVRGLAGWRRHLAVASSLLFSLWVFTGIRAADDHARRPLLRDLRGMTPELETRLRMIAVPTPERLYRAVSESSLQEVAGRLSLPEQRLAEPLRHATLALHKGMGTVAAGLLLDAGVSSVDQLVSADAERLAAELRRRAAPQGLRGPRDAIVAVWIRAAGPGGRPHR